MNGGLFLCLMKKSTSSLINITVYAGNIYLNELVNEVCEQA
jgi:hypothetical protein